MGMDINLYVEYQRDKKWHSADDWIDNIVQSIFFGRNMDLFHILGSIGYRWNYYPIDKPRGLPYKLSQEVLFDALSFRKDGFNKSYYSLKELKDYYLNLKPVNIKLKKYRKHKESLLFMLRCISLFNIIYRLEKKKSKFQITDDEDIRIIFWFDW